MNADGSNQHAITGAAVQGECCGIFSPNGRRIAFVGSDGSDYEVRTMNPDGSGQAPITNNNVDDFGSLGWQPIVRCRGRRATLVGTGLRDRLVGTKGRDVIVGRGGRDTLIGRGGRDLLCGGAGRDRLRGGAGRDRLLGGGGRDRCAGGPGRDRARGCERVRSL
jgi:Ca2+-binding RTX toxin-like protein